MASKESSWTVGKVGAGVFCSVQSLKVHSEGKSFNRIGSVLAFTKFPPRLPPWGISAANQQSKQAQTRCCRKKVKKAKLEALTMLGCIPTCFLGLKKYWLS
jgi:hypothetical protein